MPLVTSLPVWNELAVAVLPWDNNPLAGGVGVEVGGMGVSVGVAVCQGNSVGVVVGDGVMVGVNVSTGVTVTVSVSVRVGTRAVAVRARLVASTIDCHASAVCVQSQLGAGDGIE